MWSFCLILYDSLDPVQFADARRRRRAGERGSFTYYSTKYTLSCRKIYEYMKTVMNRMPRGRALPVRCVHCYCIYNGKNMCV